jgi:predicted XRE-type DNA-binding protein
MTADIRIEDSSGNVFADLGFPHSEQELIKAKLTFEIYRIIKARGLTQAKAAKVLGIQQPHVSALMKCRPATFSMGRLMEFLTALDQDVEIAVHPKSDPQGSGKISVRTREPA